MLSTDGAWAITWDTGGLADVLEADTRLDLHIRGRLTAGKTKAAADNETTQDMDLELVHALRDLIIKIRNV